MRKYFALGRAEWLDALNNRGEILLWIILELFPMFVMSSLWLSNKVGASSLGYSFSQLITYYLLVVVISRLTNHYFDQGMQNEIRDGSFSRYLLKPLPMPISFLAPSVGGKLFHFLFLFLPIILAIMFFMQGNINLPTFTNFLLFCVSLISAFFIQYSLSVVVTTFAFYLEQSSAFMHAKWVLENVAGGYVIPLSIYPLWAQSILNFLPFKYLYYIPASIFLGKISVGDSLLELVRSFMWVAVLLFISHSFWKNGVKKYSSAGG